MCPDAHTFNNSNQNTLKASVSMQRANSLFEKLQELLLGSDRKLVLLHRELSLDRRVGCCDVHDDDGYEERKPQIHRRCSLAVSFSLIDAEKKTGKTSRRCAPLLLCSENREIHWHMGSGTCQLRERKKNSAEIGD